MVDSEFYKVLGFGTFDQSVLIFGFPINKFLNGLRLITYFRSSKVGSQFYKVLGFGKFFRALHARLIAWFSLRIDILNYELGLF